MSENKKRVIDRVKVAADKGDADSQFILASMYDVFPEYRNEEEAFKYYKLAADNGIAEAQYKLGIIYSHNSIFNFVDVNLEEAFKYYKLAADNGYAPAQYEIACIYERGMYRHASVTGAREVVITKNNTDAFKYYKLAALGGIDEALIRVLEICARTNEDELFEEFYKIASNSENELVCIFADNLSQKTNIKRRN